MQIFETLVNNEIKLKLRSLSDQWIPYLMVSKNIPSFHFGAIKNCMLWVLVNIVIENYINIANFKLKLPKSVSVCRLNTIPYELPHFIRKTVSQVLST